MLDPEEADAVGAVVDRDLDVVVRTEVGLHGDQLAVEREGGLATGATAARPRPVEGLQSCLECAACLRIRRDHDGAARAVDEQLLEVPDAVHDLWRTRD